MRRRTALSLAVVGGGALAASLLVGRSRDALPEGGGRLAFDGLAARLLQAARVEIAGAGKTATLARTGESWGVAERQGYPVLLSRLREFLTGLAELRLLEPRTADAAQFGRLGVDEPGPQSSAASVRVLDGSGTVLASLIAGHRRTLTRGNVAEQIYIRLPDSPRAWLAEGRLAADADPLSWVSRDLVDLAANTIASAKITRGDETLSFGREGADFRLLSPSAPNLDTYKVESVAAALAGLTLSDVHRPPLPGTPLGQSVFRTGEGLELTFTLSRDGDRLWTTIAASGPGAERHAGLAGWVYQLPEWKERGLAPRLSDLTAAPPPAKPASPAPEAKPDAGSPD